MTDPLSYRIILASLGTVLVVLAIGMVALAFIGRPIPGELSSALSVLAGLLGGALLPSPVAGPGRSIR